MFVDSKVFTMKYMAIRTILLCMAGMLFALPGFSQDISVIKDSLLHDLSQADNTARRLEILTNLADLSSGQKDPTYSRMLWNEAIAANDESAASAAITRLLVNKLDSKEIDSLFYYADQARKLLKSDAGQAIPTYYEMIYEARKLQGIDSEECTRIAEENMEKLKRGDSKINKYERMKNLYIAICCEDRIIQLQENRTGDLERTLRYAKEMLEIAHTVPFETGGFLFVQQALSICCNSYTRDSKEYVDYTLQQLAAYENYLKLPALQKRPYYSQRSRIRAYGALSSAQTLTQHERDAYFEKTRELLRIYPSQAPSPPAAYYLANVGYEYYNIKKDNANALKQLDSLLKYNTYPLQAIKFMKLKADLLSQGGRYKEAYLEYTQATALSDSLNRQESQDKYQELQTLYDVNETRLKNAELQQHNQMLTLWTCLIVLFLLSAWSFYNYRVRRKMQKLNIKIQESETMKSAFLHSMCHEIRTPLNIISGFSTTILLVDPDEEEKESMGAEIERQTLLLTKMLDDILEVTKLDASDDTLPTEDTDIYAECGQAIEKFSFLHTDQKWVLDAAPSDILVHVNRSYFHQLIDNLLSNAAKFSEPGACTTLSYTLDKRKRLVQVSITDTGIGIPEDKHKWIFERFTKVDEFKQGAGLGLYICRLIVKRMGGHIYIDKEYKQGVRIVFELPMK